MGSGKMTGPNVRLGTAFTRRDSKPFQSNDDNASGQRRLLTSGFWLQAPGSF